MRLVGIRKRSCRVYRNFARSSEGRYEWKKHQDCGYKFCENIQDLTIQQDAFITYSLIVDAEEKQREREQIESVSSEGSKGYEGDLVGSKERLADSIEKRRAKKRGE